MTGAARCAFARILSDALRTRQKVSLAGLRNGRTQWVVVSAAVVQRNCGGLMAGPRSDVQPLFNVLFVIVDEPSSYSRN